MAAAIYFIVVVPMNHMIERRNRKLGINKDDKEEADEDPQIALLTETRDYNSGPLPDGGGPLLFAVPVTR